MLLIPHSSGISNIGKILGASASAFSHNDLVNAMLLNEFLKEHRTVQEQGATIARLKKNFQATVFKL